MLPLSSLAVPLPSRSLSLTHCFSISLTREKIGIVGRTGAGKSSIIAALYRLYPRTGDVLIDGVGTANLVLEKLRSVISVIPQDPVIFSYVCGWGEGGGKEERKKRKGFTFIN